MQFWKINDTGNDFILLNYLKEHLSPSSFPTLARQLCHRHIGANGLMILDVPTAGGDFRMLFYNADSSMSEMCGSGARCLCRFGYELGMSGDSLDFTGQAQRAERLRPHQGQRRIDLELVHDQVRNVFLTRPTTVVCRREIYNKSPIFDNKLEYINRIIRNGVEICRLQLPPPGNHALLHGRRCTTRFVLGRSERRVGKRYRFRRNRLKALEHGIHQPDVLCGHAYGFASLSSSIAETAVGDYVVTYVAGKDWLQKAFAAMGDK